MADKKKTQQCPMHTNYSSLLSQLRGDHEAMANALKDASKRMSSGQVWNGSSGSAPDTFNQQLAHKNSDLSGKVGSTISEVQRALNATPATCSDPACQPPGRCKKLPVRTGPRPM